MHKELFEKLLWMGESESLDFKRDQYPFVGASDEVKSELLKDILAFANSWRETEARILIGVQEVPGARGIVHGVQAHLTDHELQQFVNGKTQKPVTFSYYHFNFEGVPCAIIEIPLQLRPVFLKKDFGKLEANTVYVRRGSSTAEANPDEIALMGSMAEPVRRPVFEAFIEPRVTGQLHFRALEIVAWLFNQGTGTADDVVVILQKTPVGVQSFDFQSVAVQDSSHPRTALALKRPLHPNDKVALLSVNLGTAKFDPQPGNQKQIIYDRDDVQFRIKILARDQAPVDLCVSFSRAEIQTLTRKQFAPC